MRNFLMLIFWVLILSTPFSAHSSVHPSRDNLHFFSADNPDFVYTGRIDFSNPRRPRFWSPGVYIVARFRGSSCKIFINDEVLYGNVHNYLEIVIDNQKPFRIQTTGMTNIIEVAKGLKNTVHTLTICKDTESGNGYLEFLGIKCAAILPAPAAPSRKIEFIGNSITCGFGSDLSNIPCGKGQWYDEHNAYLAYGPLTARALHARWQLTAVSGIGLIHSCCNMAITMPEVYDKLDLRDDSIAWDPARYRPDIITICLGQNDGVQDSVAFCSAYVRFIRMLRNDYPAARIVCLNSPMANQQLTAVLKNYLTGVVNYLHAAGDQNVHKYFFSRSFNSGCGGHPDLAQHQIIAGELTAYLRGMMKW
ncbi:MAG TPA: SGNH/GDSL hydrolase family protein [Chitinophagaceae bacterium]|nr:SGNH/GDSL hydrolase family protein [Chitinophagaceae bacterium]